MKFIACDESKRLSYKNVMKDYDGNEPMVLEALHSILMILKH